MRAHGHRHRDSHQSTPEQIVPSTWIVPVRLRSSSAGSADVADTAQTTGSATSGSATTTIDNYSSAAASRFGGSFHSAVPTAEGDIDYKFGPIPKLLPSFQAALAEDDDGESLDLLETRMAEAWTSEVDPVGAAEYCIDGESRGRNVILLYTALGRASRTAGDLAEVVEPVLEAGLYRPRAMDRIGATYGIEALGRVRLAPCLLEAASREETPYIASFERRVAEILQDGGSAPAMVRAQG